MLKKKYFIEYLSQIDPKVYEKHFVKYTRSDFGKIEAKQVAEQVTKKKITS